MSDFRKLAISLICTSLALPAFAWQAVSGDPTSGYHMKVVSRSTQAVDYRRRGSTKVDLKGTDLMPAASGEAKIESKSGRVEVDANLNHVRPANSFGLAYLAYVLWAITPEGRPDNLGELVVKDEKASLHVTTEVQAFALIVTAEPYFAVTQPSDLVIAQNVIRRDTTGGIEPVNVNFEMLPHDLYAAHVTAIPEPIYGINNKIPLDLLQARNALRVAKEAKADHYASSSYDRAQKLLDRAEDYFRRKQGVGPIGTVAREASQTAEEARVMSLKRQQEEAADQERQAAAQRTSDAEAQAEEQRRRADEQRLAAEQSKSQAEEAQAKAQTEAQQRQQAEAQQQAAEQARASADAARQQAELATQQANQQAQQAELARQQADQARQQSENEKLQMRARLLQQLNQVLQTKDSARGLIVSMPDVLFDTGKADLKPVARERLAKVAGILLAYPDIRVEIDGHTDNTGTLSFNQKLSEQRAESVRAYLGQQGVAQGSMTTQGFGPTQPVTSNDTVAGRRQNRRVELIVSGESIGGAHALSTNPPSGDDQKPASAPMNTPPQ
ncbi:MAG: OmpA family protein [Acidobacteriaceae bacterium]